MGGEPEKQSYFTTGKEEREDRCCFCLPLKHEQGIRNKAWEEEEEEEVQDREVHKPMMSLRESGVDIFRLSHLPHPTFLKAKVEVKRVLMDVSGRAGYRRTIHKTTSGYVRPSHESLV